MKDKDLYLIMKGKCKGLLGWIVKDSAVSFRRKIVDIRVSSNIVRYGYCGIISHLSVKTEHLVLNGPLAQVLYL